MRAQNGSPMLALATLFAAGCAAAAAAEPAAGKSVPTTRLSREELVRKWDLNADGKVDKSEAELASSRMRRERAEMRLKSRIDPVTGRPRGEAAPEPKPEPPDADTLFGAEAEPADADEAQPERPALPGTRAPRTAAPRPSRPRVASSAADKDEKDEEPTPRPSRIRQPLTGGVRGGGVAARPGHGGREPSPPLNAGRPIESLRAGAGAVSGPPQAATRGGLVPRRPAPRPTREIYDPY
jgi:hypothetical protein